MFTGIVEAVGKIVSVTPQGNNEKAGVRLEIDAGSLSMDKVGIGDSIAINGACMTVVEKTDSGFRVDVSRESLSRTAGLDKTGKVNLEKALAFGDTLGGAPCFRPCGWHRYSPQVYAGCRIVGTRCGSAFRTEQISGL